MPSCLLSLNFFFFNDTATTEIYTLSLHDALPICIMPRAPRMNSGRPQATSMLSSISTSPCSQGRSEEHTSELQSPCNLVCRLLLEKKKNHFKNTYSNNILIYYFT